jgi:metal-responsive CopG/Arc/MetJ family transcriptional regulator
VKTAISIPDAVFHQVEEHAARLKISRSAFLTHAAQRYIKELDRDDAVARINAAVEYIGDTDDTAVVVADYGRRHVAGTLANDEW